MDGMGDMFVHVPANGTSIISALMEPVYAINCNSGRDFLFSILKCNEHVLLVHIQKFLMRLMIIGDWVFPI